MAEDEAGFEEEAAQSSISQGEAAEARKTLAGRCAAAGLALEESVVEGQPLVKVGMRCGRDVRWLSFWSDERVVELLSIPFEKYILLADYDAISSYEDGLIEASFRPVMRFGTFLYRRLFTLDGVADLDSVKFVLERPQSDRPRIEISATSEHLTILSRSRPRVSNQLSLKLTDCRVKTHDQSVNLLKQISGALFFQIDLIAGVPLELERELLRIPGTAKRPGKFDLSKDLEYPKNEFDDAPLSLYSYGRSATGMPLLQFLAFYQAVEFYFPTYARAEAQRRLKTILKDPTFRGDRDTDVGRLLTTISVNRGGGFGDEREQLRATLKECVDAEGLRAFFESNVERRQYYEKGRDQPFHKIPLSNVNADLNGEVAERIYEIRCKIVHSKNESRDGGLDLLLPYSSEAQRLFFDVELMQFLAQAVLITASTPL